MVRYGPIPLSDLADKNNQTPGAAIRQIGSSRRIFLLNPELTTSEMEGLAARIQLLAKNTSLSSILLANNLETDCDVDATLPTSALEMEKLAEGERDLFMEEVLDLDYSNKEWIVAAGYDVARVPSMNQDERRRMLNSMTKLAKAVKGSKVSTLNKSEEYVSKIPFISVPHGLITDGGYAVAMGSYVLATSESRFRIMNPMRGLSLDPIGLSYILPRLGWEFQQPSASYPVGSILALTGYEADASDMIETGLATHFMDSVGKLGSVERALSNLAPYDQQKLIREPFKRYGETSENSFKVDINSKFRNAAVASLMHSVSAYDAMGQEVTAARDEVNFLSDEDPSLILDADRASFFGDRESMLLNIAATFQDAFENAKSIEEIMEKMREHASAHASNEEEAEFVLAAQSILEDMEAQSPLALSATHKLMVIGKEAKESLESCMEREKKVQLKLFDKDDFKNWSKSGVKEGEFKDWKHKSVKEVTRDEIEELFK
jgi:enoyl-CoA hydratase/carnithine racemase